MRCPKCGYENPNDANFCIACGEKLERKQEDHIKICPNCGAKNYEDSVFCTVCGRMFEEQKKEDVNSIPDDFEIVKKEKASPLNLASLIVSIVGASMTLIALNEALALIALTVSLVSLVMLAIGLLTKKITGSVKFTIGLGIFGIIGNMFWLAFFIWMLPNF